MSTHNADALKSVPVPAALTRRHALGRLLGLAGAGLALAALPAVAHAAPAAFDAAAPCVLDTPPAWAPPSPAVSAIIGAQLKNLTRFVGEVGPGLVHLDAARAGLEARGEAIYDEFVAGRGPEAEAAYDEAMERVAYGFGLIVAAVDATRTGGAGTA